MNQYGGPGYTLVREREGKWKQDVSEPQFCLERYRNGKYCIDLKEKNNQKDVARGEDDI